MPENWEIYPELKPDVVTEMARKVEIDVILRRLSNLPVSHKKSCETAFWECTCDYSISEWVNLARDACAKLSEYRDG